MPLLMATSTSGQQRFVRTCVRASVCVCVWGGGVRVCVRVSVRDGASNGDHLIFSGAKLVPSETACFCMFFFKYCV